MKVQGSSRELWKIAQLLKMRRVLLGYTQRELAAMLGLKSHSIICRLENQQARKHGMTAAFLCAWAAALDCEIRMVTR